ncbi:MAG: hypothetical protein ACJ8F7_23005 [Gemmataceae bacterium]
MAEATGFHGRLQLNGDETARKQRAKKPPTRPCGRRPNRLARRVALAVGGVGVGVLALSVSHCTEAISLLTGSHWALAALLAVGIDAGMVSAELAELASHGSKAERRVKPWANGYVVAAVLLSVLLNAYAFGLHATPGMVWAAWLLGGAIPFLIYALGRVAGHLWLGE